ncbi:MAG: ORF6N domain-containing protein [Candidatus Parcubacteria bacterium]|nr:ORF6N domain-containing protein [Candidatus Parcubacteria bacterium]
MPKPDHFHRQLIPVETIGQRILFIRGHKVMLDRDLAVLYGVPTFRLNEAVKRNRNRFPEDFMFQLTKEETGLLISQIAIPKKGRGGRRTLPYAFTEHGVAMLSSVLNSERAVQINILIIRAFVKLREILSAHKDLAGKLEEMEKKYDARFKIVFDAIRELMKSPPSSSRRIGFKN